MRQETSLGKEVNKNFKVIQRCYKFHHVQHMGFAPFFEEGIKVYPNKRTWFHLVTKTQIAKRWNESSSTNEEL